jgi:hypothetical protein
MSGTKVLVLKTVFVAVAWALRTMKRLRGTARITDNSTCAEPRFPKTVSFDLQQ